MGVEDIEPGFEDISPYTYEEVGNAIIRILNRRLI